MATIQKRKSHGQTYWYVVESRRVNGKPRPVTLAYLGKAEDLLTRLMNQRSFELKSYSHGDTAALLNAALELDIANIINKYVGKNKDGERPIRDGFTVGASFLLAAIGRACHPTSKKAWYDWCRETSLEYCLRASFKKLDSQHFWDQMEALPEQSIPLIEEEIVKSLVDKYPIEFDCLFFDTTNYFTFISSGNEHCDLAQRGKNKQKRGDLRQVGMALLVSRKEQFPLFHRTYRGNKNDITVFKEIFSDLVGRLRNIAKELSDITIVFDKGNNSKDNFNRLDSEEDLYYVASLVPSHFKKLIKEANDNFQTMSIGGEQVPVYRIKEKVWGQIRTCVVTISAQLKEGQIRGIGQHLEKKYKILDKFKAQLESSRRRKSFGKKELEAKLKTIIRGQFIENILKYEFVKLQKNHYTFTYFIDQDAFEVLKNEILGRRILTTNRHDWDNEEIILAYRGQSKVEYAFRTLKNPYHLAVRPQYHWTDQKIAVHVLMCVIGYLLSVCVYTKAIKTGYRRNIENLLEDLRTIRLAGIIDKKKGKGQPRVYFKLEKIRTELQPIANTLGITSQNIRPKTTFRVYN